MATGFNLLLVRVREVFDHLLFVKFEASLVTLSFANPVLSRVDLLNVIHKVTLYFEVVLGLVMFVTGSIFGLKELGDLLIQALDVSCD